MLSPHLMALLLEELLLQGFFFLYKKVVYIKQITRNMIKIYKPLGRDWLNYKITQSNKLTFHHIVKKADGGKAELSNGALLTEIGHQYLHLIECKDKDTYITINKIFKVINNQMASPNEEQRAIIEYLLQEFEEKHSQDKSSKGKPLIKDIYKRRF